MTRIPTPTPKPTEVERLLLALQGTDALRRDAAAARLRIIGARAVERLAWLAASGQPPAHRRLALDILDGLDDERAVTIALSALHDPEPDVRIAAARVLRGWVTRESDTRILDTLSTIALDHGEPAAVRTAALEALSELPAAIVAPIAQQADLDSTADPSSADATEEAGRASAWLTAHADAPLSDLHDRLVRARMFEQESSSAAARKAWRHVRGAAHLALARRESTVALYDLREAFEAAMGPLPLDFLMAVTTLGDETCLEPLARAWAASTDDPWWRDRVAATARGIVRRLRLRTTHARVRRVRAKWPGFL